MAEIAIDMMIEQPALAAAILGLTAANAGADESARQKAAEQHLRNLAQAAAAAVFTLPYLRNAESELSLVFTDDAAIRCLNARWRHKDKATNVLSFPAFPVKAGQKPMPLLGDIVISLETVQAEAKGQNKPLDHHLSHLLVHGLLHLLGYDHITDPEAEVMEGLERQILAGLAIDDPYAESL